MKNLFIQKNLLSTELFLISLYPELIISVVIFPGEINPVYRYSGCMLMSALFVLVCRMAFACTNASDFTPPHTYKAENRIAALDILKGIGIIMTIYGHWIYSSKYVCNMIWSVHMPLFFFATGYTFSYKPAKIFFEKNLKTLLYPYSFGVFVIWVGCLLNHKYYTGDWGNISKSLIQYILMGIYGSGSYSLKLPDGTEILPIGALWFICALFICKFIFNCILSNIEHERDRTFIVAAITISGYILGKNFSQPTGIWMPFSIESGMTGLLFMYFGFLARQKNFFQISRFTLFVALSIYIIAIITGNGTGFVTASFPMGYFDFMGVLSGCIVWYKIALLIEHRTIFIKKLLEITGRNTLYILIFHLFELNWINWSGLMSAILRGNSYGLIDRIILFTIKFLFSFIMALIVNFFIRKIRHIKITDNNTKTASR